MATEKRLIDANAIPYEEHYVPDLDSGKQWDYKKELCVLKPVIDQMPTVDAVEVVHGRWEPHMEEMEDFFGKMQLVQTGLMYSECGHYSSCGGNYCNNCGAKMDRERKDDD